MKLIGITLIIIGIVMLIFRSFSFTQEKKIIDAGPIQVERKENKTVEWPMYAGGIAVIAGIGILLLGKKAE